VARLTVLGATEDSAGFPDPADGGAMQRVEVAVRFQGKSTRRPEEPLQSDPRATSVFVEARTSDGRAFEMGRASYSNHVTHTGESTFSEVGTISFGSAGGEIDIVTAGDGFLGQSADADLRQGAVVYRIVEGRGRFVGASGLISSNFLLCRATGEFEERQIAVVFLP
jgi:hypothetical protein